MYAIWWRNIRISKGRRRLMEGRLQYSHFEASVVSLQYIHSLVSVCGEIVAVMTFVVLPVS